MPMKRWVRKKGWEKSILIEQPSTGACQTHAFSFLWEQAQWSIKEDISRETAGSQHPQSDTSRLAPDLWIPEHPPACQGWARGTGSRLILETNLLHFPFPLSCSHCDQGRMWHRNWKIDGPQPCQDLQRWPKQHWFHAINNWIRKANHSGISIADISCICEQPIPVCRDTWQKLNGKNLKSAFLNFLFKFLMYRTKDIHFL